MHAHLDAPFTQITEGADAIDFRADADFSSAVGTGPEQCMPPAGAPDLDSTFDVAGAPPVLGPTTPSGQPYGLGLTISASAFNQLLGSMTECGILNQEVTQIAFGDHHAADHGGGAGRPGSGVRDQAAALDSR